MMDDDSGRGDKTQTCQRVQFLCALHAGFAHLPGGSRHAHAGDGESGTPYRERDDPFQSVHQRAVRSRGLRRIVIPAEVEVEEWSQCTWPGPEHVAEREI